jgi:hypothetical protein
MAWTNGTFLCKPKSKLDSHIGAERNLGPKRRGKQGELVGTRTCLKPFSKMGLKVLNFEKHLQTMGLKVRKTK